LGIEKADDRESGAGRLKEIFRNNPERFIIATIPSHRNQPDSPKYSSAGMDFE